MELQPKAEFRTVLSSSLSRLLWCSVTHCQWRKSLSNFGRMNSHPAADDREGGGWRQTIFSNMTSLLHKREGGGVETKNSLEVNIFWELHLCLYSISRIWKEWYTSHPGDASPSWLVLMLIKSLDLYTFLTAVGSAWGRLVDQWRVLTKLHINRVRRYSQNMRRHAGCV